MKVRTQFIVWILIALILNIICIITFIQNNISPAGLVTPIIIEITMLILIHKRLLLQNLE